MWEWVGGCLIAFACRESFKRGYEGWVFLVPKTNLIEHYHSNYGFLHVRSSSTTRPNGIMTLNGKASQKIITDYFD